MTDSQVVMTIEGLDEALAKMEPSLYAEPLRQMFTKAAITIQSAARENAMSRWHDTGQVANEIVYQIDGTDPPQYAKVGLLNASPGSPLWFKARAGEYGTGSAGDPSVSHMASHWPPGDALGVWAGRHGFDNGFQVAAAIGKRGGLEPRRYLRDAFQSAKSTVQGLIAEFAAAVGAKWSQP